MERSGSVTIMADAVAPEVDCPDAAAVSITARNKVINRGVEKNIVKYFC